MKSVLGVLRRPVTAAVAGQVTQAAAGLVLQVAAARSLGASGFGAFAVAYGAIVLATAVCSGLVGDSLTVLDRREPGVRAALHGWTVVVSAGAGVLGVLATVLTDLGGTGTGLLLGLATAAFIVEDTLRRLLMATGRFWSLSAVDGTSLVLALSTLAGLASLGELTFPSFVVALLVGQVGASVTAYVLLPASERPHGPWRRPAWAEVFAFGSWRAATQTIRPALMTALRLLVVATAGVAAYGPIEAARVYTAPTLVLVGGLGSFLLPHFVALRGRPVAHSLRVADRAALGLAVAVALIGAAALLVLPFLGPVITGGDYGVPAAAVAGWSAYAVASALLLPYGAMASAHREQARVLGLRTLELLSLAAVLVLVLTHPSHAAWAPLALAIGPLLAAAAVRRRVLRPLVDRPRQAEVVAVG
ncbi:hypothetical protein [Blastococcus haudaquaticus]|uniref:Membrane protein involved in the export of O-antigen and teichoic acid n=1 Tax=Blastococcus haudaquaticus TaxID=1938745 RepID=A0A286GZU4_9ACTN|nr:hypothetical protein [Blastococcus haudaquaticus]SOE01058.1 Membrane protein involved in the export of O-antigen and teichoic acid [Blastococcus haudaquaticus]